MRVVRAVISFHHTVNDPSKAHCYFKVKSPCPERRSIPNDGCCTVVPAHTESSSEAKERPQRRDLGKLVVPGHVFFDKYLWLLFWSVCLPFALPWLRALDNKGAALCETCLRLCLASGA